jgi:hypothetical protein
VVTWEEFAQAAPDLADAGLRLFTSDGIGWLATVRRDGSPRLHAIVPIFAAGHVAVFIPDSSPKRYDLLRDGRYVLHAPLGADDEEFSIQGHAAPVDDAATRAMLATAAGHTIREHDLAFIFGIQRCLWAIWQNVGQPNTRPIRRRWDAP